MPQNAAGIAAPINEVDSGDEYNEDPMNMKSLAASVNVGIREASLGEENFCQGDNPLDNFVVQNKTDPDRHSIDSFQSPDLEKQQAPYKESEITN